MKREVNEKKVTVNEKGQVFVPVPLRVNKESIVDGKVGDKQVVYRRIGRGTYPCIIEMVTEEEYQIYMQFEQTQVKQEVREKRCRIYDEETKGYIMCPECNKCINCRKHADWKFNNMHEVSLESFIDEEDDNSEGLPIKGREVNDGSDLMAEQIAEMIEAELYKIKPKFALIFREMYNGNLKPKNIAEKTNLATRTTYKDVPKVMKEAQRIFEILMQE